MDRLQVFAMVIGTYATQRIQNFEEPVEDSPVLLVDCFDNSRNDRIAPATSALWVADCTWPERSPTWPRHPSMNLIILPNALRTTDSAGSLSVLTVLDGRCEND